MTTRTTRSTSAGARPFRRSRLEAALAKRSLARGLGAVLLSAGVTGCSSADVGGATTGTGGETSGTGGAPTRASGSGGNTTGTGGGTGGGSTGCGPDEKRCDSGCVNVDDPAYGCGPTTCGACQLDHATAACTGGACGVGECKPGFADCNADPSDGCEANLASPLTCGACAGACAPPDGCHTLGTCDPTTKSCSYAPKPDGTACNDGNACTKTDVCITGTCVGTKPVTCAPADTCHVAGACDPTTGACAMTVKADGAPCDDGNLCTQGDTCAGGTCVGGELLPCVAKDSCHVANACDPTTGMCLDVAKPDGASCDDGDACTQTDLCMSGTCVGQNPVLCSTGQCAAAATCDPGTGKCVSQPQPNGTPCDDGNACTTSDVCSAGVCTGASCATGICGATTQAFTGSFTPGWQLNGTAVWDATAGSVLLVAGAQRNSAGTVIYQDPIVVDAFDVTFEFAMTVEGAGRADGITFMLEKDGPTALGATGGGLGVAGLHGYAVELDIYNNAECGDVDGNHAAIDLLTTCGGGHEPTPVAVSPYLYDTTKPAGGIGDIADGVWRPTVVHFAGGAMSVSIRDIPVPNLQNVVLPGLTPGGAYYFGFSAGSGGAAARQEIRNVQIAFPTQRCL